MNNKISTGTLNLYISNTDVVTPDQQNTISMTATNAKPGDDNVPLTNIPVYVWNTGTITGALNAKVVPIAGGEDLSKYLKITAIVRSTRYNYPITNTVVIWDKGPVNGGQGVYLDTLANGDRRNVEFMYSFPESYSSQSDANGKTFNFNIEFTLKQI